MWIKRALSAAVILAAFAAVGTLVGWLAGASSTPVVAAVVPLIFGLLGALGFGYAEAAGRLRRIQELLQEAPADLASRLRNALGQSSHDGLRLPSFWAAAVIVLCAACFWGVRTGVGLRVPSYPSLQELVGSSIVTTRQEAAELHAFRLALQRQNIPAADAVEIFAHVVAPFYQLQQYRSGGELADVRADSRRQAIRRVMAASAEPQGPGRGPASDPTRPQ